MMDLHKRNTDGDMYRHLKVLTCLTCVMIVFLVGLVGYWSLYPYEPMTVTPEVFPIVYPGSKVVYQGSILAYEFQYVRDSDVVPTLQRQFVDGLVFNVAGDTLPTVVERGSGTARVQVFVPNTLPPGNYQLKIITQYQVNPIRSIRYTHLTEQFQVVARLPTDTMEEALKR